MLQVAQLSKKIIINHATLKQRGRGAQNKAAPFPGEQLQTSISYRPFPASLLWNLPCFSFPNREKAARINANTGRGERTHGTGKGTKPATANKELDQGEPGEESQLPTTWKNKLKELTFLSLKGHSFRRDVAGVWLAGRKRISRAASATRSRPNPSAGHQKSEEFWVQGFYPPNGSRANGKPKLLGR